MAVIRNNLGASVLRTETGDADGLDVGAAAAEGVGEVAEPPPAVTVRALAQVLEQWRQLGQTSGQAHLFHTPQWAEALRRAYGFRVLAATMERQGKIVAGCLLARTKNPFARNLVALPFSDSCPPLGVDEAATTGLMRGLAAEPYLGARLEIRGIRASAPWQTVDCFQRWSLNLERPFAEIHRKVDRNFRRQARRAAETVKVESGDSETMLRRFYAIQLETRRRLAVPPQPLRFFAIVREVFVRDHAIEVWLASSEGRDQAAVVLLREGSRLYVKWSARAAESAAGASHLLFSNLLEHHAGKAAELDLGRTDARNVGLARFKAEMGASSEPLPYSYFPQVPHRTSAEAPEHSTSALARTWRRLPLPVTRAIGALTYRYLA